MHIWEDAYLAEIVDPETGEQLPDGEIGELVHHHPGREGMPLIRSRTKDLTRFIPGDCPCDPQTPPSGPHHGPRRRHDHPQGVNIYPMQVEQVLMSIPEVGQNYLIVLEREATWTRCASRWRSRKEYFVEDMRELKSLQSRISSRLRDEILITARIDLVEQNSLPKSEGKAQGVLDLRE